MSNKLIINAITAVIALSVNASAVADNQVTANKKQTDMQNTEVQGMDRCFGIAKAGLNDCGNSSHSCSGGAKIDSDPNEWLFVPTGLCRRIVGGNLKLAVKS